MILTPVDSHGRARDPYVFSDVRVPVPYLYLNWGGPAVDEARFDPAACAANYGVYHDAESCYLLAVLARKPA